MIAAFDDKLRRAKIELTPREIAEALFLASRMGPSPRVALPKPPPPPPPDDGLDSQKRDQTSTKSGKSSDPAALAKEGDLFPSRSATQSATSGVPAVNIRAASAIALPGARGIGRALRPLLRRHPSRTRRELDIERTIETIADAGVNLVVERPATERWLEAALVVDESETMRAWRPTVREFQRLLERHGAFRDVRVWGMNADGGKPALYSRIGRIAPPRQLRDPRELLDAAGRRLIVVLSDCHAEAWHNGEAFRLLAGWGKESPVVLAQMLPQALWEPTAMPRLDARLRADAPGAPNAQLADDRRRQGKRVEIPVPVVVLEDWAILPWAQMLAARGKASAKGFLIPRQWPKPEAPETEDAQVEDDQREVETPSDVPPDAEDAEVAASRIKSFRASATPTAFRLACHLAAVELNLPVMRLVQQAMLPGSRQSHLAEVLLGGLVRQSAGSVEAAENPDDILYEFYPQVREELLTNRHSNPRDTMRVITEVTRLIENRLPYASEFHAMVAMPGIESDTRVEVGKRAFATISPVALRSLGFGALAQAATGGGAVQLARKEIESLYRSLDDLLDRQVFPNADAWGRRIETIPLHASALRLAMERGEDGQALEAIAALAGLLVEIGELDTAFELYRQLKTLGEKQGSPPSAIEAHIGFGQIHLARAEAELALDDFDHAQELALAVSDAVWLAEVFAKLAAAYRRLGLGVGFDRAIESAVTAIASTSDSAVMARMHDLIGAVSVESVDEIITPVEPVERQRLLDRGEEAFNRAIALWRELGDQRALCTTLFNYGQLLKTDGRTDRAMEAYRNALHGFVQLQDKDGEAAAFGAISNLDARNGNHSYAIEGYFQAAKLYELLNKPFKQAGALHLLARSAFALNRVAEATRAGEQALALYSQLTSAREQQLRMELAEWRGAVRVADFSFETVTLDARGEVKERAQASVRLYTELLDDEVELDLVAISGGTFRMGSSGNEGGSWRRETPRHQVRLSPFLIGQFPVTQQQWRVVAGWDRTEKLDLGARNPALSHLEERGLLRAMSKEKLNLDPSSFKGDQLPVEEVSWEESVRFCVVLSAKTGRQYRLPTEAEWEYACRAGTETPFAFGETITPEYVNYNGEYPYAKVLKGEYREKMTLVGSLKVPNAWGLYDMHGNVWEWCQDWASDEYYEECYRQGVVADPQGPAPGSSRVYRGGGWYNYAVDCRSAYRGRYAPGYRDDHVGFRLVRVGP